MIVGVPKEIYPGERRVALVPAVVPSLVKAGMEVLVESGAGVQSGYPDDAYAAKGARISGGRDEVFGRADVVLQVLCHGANDVSGAEDLPRMRPGQAVIGFLRPLASPRAVRELAERGVTSIAVELVPRTSRAQAMDVLSAMATIAGYKAVLLAAETLPRMFPMLMTAAGTISPAHVLVIGAGVAGLQAIGTARRLGAVASAYDLRPAAQEQIRSVGGRVVELPIDTADAEGARGRGRRLFWWDFLFYAIFGFVVTSSVQIAGVLLVFGLLVIPAVAGLLTSPRPAVALAVGWAFAFVACLAGLLGSVRWDLPAAPSVLVALSALLLVLGVGLRLARGGGADRPA